jgi:hypothetical protein
MKKKLLLAISIAFTGTSLSALPVGAADTPFPEKVFTQPGSPPEGFAIGKGHTAYQGSLDGSIYKVDLRSGKGEVLVDVVEPWDPVFFSTCRLLGMRVDPRTNFLFGAGCYWGNALVYDADTGALVAEYQLDSSGNSVINDLAITGDAVYFTDFGQPYLYRLPLGRNGEVPAANAAVAIPLIGEYGDGVANGIVATPDGRTLIVGDPFRSKIFRVDPATGYAREIIVQPPLLVGGFLDAIVMHERTLYIMTPDINCPPVDRIQVVKLDKDLLTGTQLPPITGADLDGVASGAIFGNSLYVNNARYCDFPEPDTEYWVTKLTIPPSE